MARSRNSAVSYNDLRIVFSVAGGASDRLEAGPAQVELRLSLPATLGGDLVFRFPHMAAERARRLVRLAPRPAIFQPSERVVERQFDAADHVDDPRLGDDQRRVEVEVVANAARDDAVCQVPLADAHVMRATMELGGQAPAIVFEDADLDHAVAALAAASRIPAVAARAAPRRWTPASFQSLPPG